MRSISIIRLARGFMSAALAFCALAVADPVSYRVESGDTTVEFAVRYLGVSTARGRFDRTSGSMEVDLAARTGSVELEIDAGSVNTGWDLRDDFLRGERMLDSARHPRMRFRSRELHFDDGRLAQVSGELTLRGATRPVHLMVTRFECPGDPASARAACVATAVGRLSRSAFGMDFAYPLISDDIDIEFRISANREPVK